MDYVRFVARQHGQNGIGLPGVPLKCMVTWQWPKLPRRPNERSVWRCAFMQHDSACWMLDIGVQFFFSFFFQSHRVSWLLAGRLLTIFCRCKKEAGKKQLRQSASHNHVRLSVVFLVASCLFLSDTATRCFWTLIIGCKRVNPMKNFHHVSRLFASFW